MSIILWLLFGILILFILGGISFANFSFAQFYDVYKKNKMICGFCGTAQDLIEHTSAKYNLNINVEIDNNELCERYSPFSNTLFISAENATSNSVSALTITAHELGHAIYAKQNPTKTKQYFKKIKPQKFFSLLLPILILSGLVCWLTLPTVLPSIIIFGFAFLIFLTLIFAKLLTVKFENTASKIAVEILVCAGLNKQNLKHSQKLLKEAKNTYVAGLFRWLLAWTGCINKINLM
ncbi:MAG: zinc metallopeptidase [Clostridia bacterium]